MSGAGGTGAVDERDELMNIGTIAAGAGALAAGGFAAHLLTNEGRSRVAGDIAERTEEFETWKGEVLKAFPGGLDGVNIDRFEAFVATHPKPDFVSAWSERNGDVRLELAIGEGETFGAGQGLSVLLGFMIAGAATMPLGMGGSSLGPIARAASIAGATAGVGFGVTSLMGLSGAPTYDALDGAIQVLNGSAGAGVDERSAP